jgi:hypothetical protein
MRHQNLVSNRFSRQAATAISGLFGAIAVSTVAPPALAISLINDLGGPRGFGEAFLNRNDDGSTPELPLPFPVNFFGNIYNSFWVNNNGNITFAGPLRAFTPSAFPGAPTPIIAPWWADVDTRNPGSGLVWYTAPNPDTVVVTWDNVGYFPSSANLLNSFQLILSSVAGTAAGAFTAEFRYDQLQWTTGSASGGSGGLGGIPAQAGYDNGDGADPRFFSLPGSRTASILDVVNQSNVSESSPGLWRFFFGEDGSSPGDTFENPLLPVVVDGNFVFDFPVTPGRVVFIDPPVTVGYDYFVGDPNGPLFASVIAPSLTFDNTFDLFTSSDACSTYSVSQGTISSGIAFNFTSPVPCFSIRGIDIAEALDPTDTTAFVTGISFDRAGTVNVTQSPIVENVDPPVDIPGPVPALGVIAALRASRQLRKRLNNTAGHC